MSTLRIHTPASLDELAEVPWLLSHAFGSPEADAAEWMKRHEPKNHRLIAEGDRTLGCLFLIPMGQFFGGRSVPMTGIAGVAVSPEARGRGVATMLMRETVLDLHRQGVALSALYPATQPLYRRAGYEMAGHCCRITFRARSMELREPLSADLVFRQAEGAWDGDGDHRRIRAFHRTHALHSNGAIDRPDLMWDRIARPRGNTACCFVIERSGTLEGYIYIWMDRPPGTNTRPVMRITDMQAGTPEAGRRLLAFIADHRSLDHEAEWHAGPLHPLLAMLGEQRYDIAKKDLWMLRIVDVPRALRGRGYNPLIRARLDLQVEDDVVEANSGSWTLRVEEGRAAVERGSGSGNARGPALALHVRSLAMLYGALLTPWQMRSAGLLSGSDEAIHAAAAIFGSDGAAWMSDLF